VGFTQRATTWTEERDGLLAHIVRSLEGDHRVRAVWLAGSQGRGSADDWSDSDLGIVLIDEAMPRLLAEPLQFVRAITPTVMHMESPQNAPAGGTHVLTMIPGHFGPQQVDWYWLPESSATRPVDTRLVFERRSIPVTPALPPLTAGEIETALKASLRDTLQMAFMVGKHLRRQDLAAALRALDYMVTCCGKAAWYENHDRHPRYEEIRGFQLHGTPLVSPDGLVQQARSPMVTLASLVERHAPELEPMVVLASEWVDHASPV
jgi:hypothetical protein